MAKRGRKGQLGIDTVARRVLEASPALPKKPKTEAAGKAQVTKARKALEKAAWLRREREGSKR
jgi:hypothetical protein